jgi:hypothetical protein
MVCSPYHVRGLRGSFGASDDGNRSRIDWIHARFSGVSLPRVSHGRLISDGRKRSRVMLFCPSYLTRSRLPNANSLLTTIGRPSVNPYWLRVRSAFGEPGAAKYDRAFHWLFW